MSDVLEEGGGVTSSSQQGYQDQSVGQGMSFMLGIVLSVQPSDDKDNRTGKSDQQNRGTRHECTVLAGTDIYHPDVLLQNVIIPPQCHSGMDNFEEDLPRGCNQIIDGSTWNLDDGGVDYGKLDGEWCVVGFLNGNMDHPFIVSWWPHPSNAFDPGTSGVAYDKKSLTQVDTKKNRARALRVLNGVMSMINREGSVYLDTTQAGRKVMVEDGKQTLTKYDKGGHVQVDVKSTSQLEINFNTKVEKGPRLGAGSTKSKPVHDPDLPHPDQPITSTTAKARETVRSYTRRKQFEVLEKTSNYNLFCENTESETDGKKGEAAILAEDTISITVSKGGGKGTMINIVKGKIQIWSDDGTQVNVLNDEVQIVTKSGGMIDVKGSSVTVSGKVDISGPVAVGGLGEPTILGTTFSTLHSTYLDAEFQFGKDAAALFTALAAACTVPPLTPLGAKFTDLATAFTTFSTAAKTLSTLEKAKKTLALNLTTT